MIKIISRCSVLFVLLFEPVIMFPERILDKESLLLSYSIQIYNDHSVLSLALHIGSYKFIISAEGTMGVDIIATYDIS